MTLRVAGGGLLCRCHPEQSEGREGRRRTEAAQCSWTLDAWVKGSQHEMVQWFISSFRRFIAGTCSQLMSQPNRQGVFRYSLERHISASPSFQVFVIKEQTLV